MITEKRMLRAKTESTTSTRAVQMTTKRTTQTTTRTTQKTTTSVKQTQTQTLSSTVYNRPPIFKFTTSTTQTSSTTSWQPSLYSRPRLTLPADWGRKTETTTENMDFVLMTTVNPVTEWTTRSTTKKMKKIKSEVMSNAYFIQPFLFLVVFLF